MKEHAKEQKTAIEKLLNEANEIKIGSKTIKVKEVSLLKNLKEITSLLRSLLAIANSEEADTPFLALGLLEEKEEDMFKLIESSTGLNKKAIIELEEEDPEALILIAQAVYEGNFDFLARAAKRLKLVS